MPKSKWSRIPYGAPLKVDGHGEVFYLSSGSWKSIYREIGITKDEIIQMNRIAFGHVQLPDKWVFDDGVCFTSIHPPMVAFADATKTPIEVSSSQITPKHLDSDAVRQANDSLWDEFPELNHRQLTTEASDLRYRRVWMKYYRAAISAHPAPIIPTTSAEPPESALVADKSKLDFIELELVDERGISVPCADFRLMKSTGETIKSGRLDNNGFIRIEPIPSDNYNIEFQRIGNCIETKGLQINKRNRSIALDSLYLDAGAWQMYQDPHQVTTFAIVAGKDVVLCNWLDASRGDESTPPGLEPIIQQLLKKFKSIPKIPTINRGFLIAHEKYEVDLLRKGKILLLIPDLHLHYYKERMVDNFAIEKADKDGKKTICSLESELVDLLKISQSICGSALEVIQLGDMFELWESRGMLLSQKNYFKQKVDWGPLDIINPANDLIIKAHLSPAEKDNIREKIAELENIVPEGASKKEHGRRISEKIKEKYPDLFNFSITNIAGNHDGLLTDLPLQEWRGQDKIQMEHGHASDPSNNSADENDVPFFGYSMTQMGAFFENLELGSQAKDTLDTMTNAGHKIIQIHESYEKNSFKSPFPDTFDVMAFALKKFLGSPDALRQYAIKEIGQKKLMMFVNAHTHSPKLERISPNEYCRTE